MSDGRRGAAGPVRSRYVYDPAADPELYAGVLSKRVVASSPTPSSSSS
jgi:hypothetical protein